MGRRSRNHMLQYGKTKRANHGVKPCRGKTTAQFGPGSKRKGVKHY